MLINASLKKKVTFDEVPRLLWEKNQRELAVIVGRYIRLCPTTSSLAYRTLDLETRLSIKHHATMSHYASQEEVARTILFRLLDRGTCAREAHPFRACARTLCNLSCRTLACCFFSLQESLLCSFVSKRSFHVHITSNTRSY